MSDERAGFVEAWLHEAGGEVSFDAWMRQALYHPRFGYYASGIRSVGYRGDFSTATTLHRGLGEAVAAWAAERRRELFGGGFRPWHLVEIGPGGGDLAAAVLDALTPSRRAGLVYHLVETSPALRDRQRARLLSAGSILRRAAQGVRLRWHDRMADAIETAGGRAIVVSNELVDAFPPIVVRWDGASWQELRLTLRGGAWTERWRALDPALLAGASSSLIARAPDLPRGQRGEIHASYREWLRAWAPRLRRGAVLTLDYGGPLDVILDRRRDGTLRAFFHHQRYEGDAVYSRFGRQDVTADVNFDDLARWGEEVGFRTVRLATQREFLLRQRPDLDDRARREPELAYLLHEGGAGGAFWALEQRTG